MWPGCVIQKSGIRALKVLIQKLFHHFISIKWNGNIQCSQCKRGKALYFYWLSQGYNLKKGTLVSIQTYVEGISGVYSVLYV